MALRRIVLRDFVIVSELELDLEGGFTVLTGETGAGKSILIDALQLVTGARADTGVIREGAPGTFYLYEPPPLPRRWARMMLFWIVVVGIPVRIIQFCQGSP